MYEVNIDFDNLSTRRFLGPRLNVSGLKGDVRGKKKNYKYRRRTVDEFVESYMLVRAMYRVISDRNGALNNRSKFAKRVRNTSSPKLNVSTCSHI